MRKSRLIIASAWHTRSNILRNTTNPWNCRKDSSRRDWESRFTALETAITVPGRHSFGRLRECRWKPKRTGKFRARVRRMFKQKQNKKAEIGTLIGAKTRINGDVEFVGGFHLDGYINGNVKCELSA